MNATASRFVVLLLPLLFACSGTSKPVSGQPTELSLAYSRLGAVQEGIVSSELELGNLVSLFDRHDDVYGAWLATFELCRYQMRLKEKEKGMNVCKDALRRAQLSGRHSAIFDTALQLYIYGGEDRYLDLAKKFADRQQDQQLLAIARGRYTSLSLPQDEHPQVAVRAYQYYWFGKQQADDQALQKAYQLFSETGNSRGLADVLFLRARLAADSGNKIDARDMASRAQLVLTAIGEQHKAAQVQAWVDNELATR